MRARHGVLAGAVRVGVPLLRRLGVLGRGIAAGVVRLLLPGAVRVRVALLRVLGVLARGVAAGVVRLLLPGAVAPPPP
ncbi:hypothetical protein [Peterkaempfera sp. SMS 1(5)a]|uniref:hypothetical protein n=1 Tax=Peterkaempfera podocarpi TaxID=3232308 RepID=UPI00366C09A1